MAPAREPHPYQPTPTTRSRIEGELNTIAIAAQRVSNLARNPTEGNSEKLRAMLVVIKQAVEKIDLLTPGELGEPLPTLERKTKPTRFLITDYLKVERED